ncbi:MAG: NOL1/NOP2/sun family putative RNA methylase [Anaerolineae bacterium]|nr:NOL1/NOP2/sun family putative RNA methylase [Anaerolineae bacterium]
MNPGSLDKYRDLLSAAEFEQLLQAVQRPLPCAIRINTLEIAVGDARRTWPAWYGWQVQPVVFCETGWQVTGESIAQTLEHKMGLYYIQDAASMLPAEMFGFKQNEPLVLDMAAAPGGKTTHLACKMGDRGLVVANDASHSRIPPLRAKLQDWGAINTVITNYPGERFGSWFPETFDKVLLDAPCSGESLRTAERRRMQPVSAQERQALHRRQLELLISAFHVLKPGGEMVYATCSLAPEEDEAVLDVLLNLYPYQAMIETVDHLLPTPAPALASDGERSFHPQVRRGVRLWPHLYDTSGFFAALILKSGSVDVQPSRPPARSLESAGFARMSQRDTASVCDHLLQAYGFDFEAVIERQALALWEHKGSIYAIPEPFLTHFADLPCVATGMQVGEQGEGEFAPSHELVARFGAQFTGCRLTLADDQAAVWLGGRDLRGLESHHPLGATILLEDERGRFLGLGKVQGNRIRNLLPQRLVY